MATIKAYSFPCMYFEFCDFTEKAILTIVLQITNAYSVAHARSARAYSQNEQKKHVSQTDGWLKITPHFLQKASTSQLVCVCVRVCVECVRAALLLCSPTSFANETPIETKKKIIAKCQMLSGIHACVSVLCTLHMLSKKNCFFFRLKSSAPSATNWTYAPL